nr:MAG TPA: hypothetical protein [Myoviridae sp. ctNPX13]
MATSKKYVLLILLVGEIWGIERGRRPLFCFLARIKNIYYRIRKICIFV